MALALVVRLLQVVSLLQFNGEHATEMGSTSMLQLAQCAAQGGLCRNAIVQLASVRLLYVQGHD